MDLTRKIVRGKQVYYLNGKITKQESVIEYINKLRIPPAWTDLKISLKKSAKRIVVGKDAAGRTQSIYNTCFIQKNKKIRMCNIIPFIKTLPLIREQCQEMLMSRKLSFSRAVATIVTLMDTCCPLRIGNEFYKNKYQTYGLSTIEKRHVTIEPNTITISFIGKKHLPNTKTFFKSKNKLLSRSMIQFYNNKRSDNEPFFNCVVNKRKVAIQSKMINSFLKQFGNFSAKDFRTLRANICLLEKLKTR